MKLPVSRALYSYWASQCRGRAAPDRHDLDPAEMRGALPYTFMLEVDAASDARAYPIRISGTRLDALFGRDLKGVAFADLWEPDDSAALRSILAGVLDDVQPVVLGLRAAPNGHAEVGFELLVLPLRHHGQTHARLLCCLVPNQTPAWLGLATIAGLGLRGWRAIDRNAEAMAEHNRLGGIRRNHLVVYQGGKIAASVPAAAPQSRVKASMPGWQTRTLSTRHS